MLLTSSLSAAELEVASEDLLDESHVTGVWDELLSNTGLEAAGPRRILEMSSLGVSLN